MIVFCRDRCLNTWMPLFIGEKNFKNNVKKRLWCAKYLESSRAEKLFSKPDTSTLGRLEESRAETGTWSCVAILGREALRSFCSLDSLDSLESLDSLGDLELGRRRGLERLVICTRTEVLRLWLPSSAVRILGPGCLADPGPSGISGISHFFLWVWPSIPSAWVPWHSTSSTWSPCVTSLVTSFTSFASFASSPFPSKFSTSTSTAAVTGSVKVATSPVQVARSSVSVATVLVVGLKVWLSGLGMPLVWPVVSDSSITSIWFIRSPKSCRSRLDGSTIETVERRKFASLTWLICVSSLRVASSFSHSVSQPARLSADSSLGAEGTPDEGTEGAKSPAITLHSKNSTLPTFGAKKQGQKTKTLKLSLHSHAVQSHCLSHRPHALPVVVWQEQPRSAAAHRGGVAVGPRALDAAIRGLKTTTSSLFFSVSKCNNALFSAVSTDPSQKDLRT